MFYFLEVKMMEIIQIPSVDDGGNQFKSDFLLLSGHIVMMKNIGLKQISSHKAMIKRHSKKWLLNT